MNRCFRRQRQELNFEEDKICKHCANRKANKCMVQWTLRDYFANGSKEEIEKCLKENNITTVEDILRNIDTVI